uniref:Uncharacterized protein n=1 Tax=Panagrolaimus superbus TaxID=310955 RepID=A0A914ZB38_9BILA
MFLCSDVRDLTLEAGTVKNDDGTIVLFEKLIKQLPNVKQFDYTFTTPSDNTSKITFKELWKISNLSNYDDFYLSNIPEDFDINSFYSFMKKNKKIRIRLDFSDTISEEYKVPLEAIINEIIGTHNHGYKPPSSKLPYPINAIEEAFKMNSELNTHSGMEEDGNQNSTHAFDKHIKKDPGAGKKKKSKKERKKCSPPVSTLRSEEK